MAFRDTTDNQSLPKFYNVTMAVGPGAPNRRDDVQLVQYLLSNIAADHPEETWPSDDLAVDGKFGPITGSYITAFQGIVQKTGRSIRADGRVDSSHGVTSSISHTIYTILHMNHRFKDDVDGTGIDYDNLQNQPDVPPDLAAAIGPPS